MKYLQFLWCPESYILVSFESESIQIKMNCRKCSHSVQARHFRRLPVSHWEHHGIRQLRQGRADPIVSVQISCHIALTVEEDLTRSYNILRDVWSLATHLMLDRFQNFTKIYQKIVRWQWDHIGQSMPRTLSAKASAITGGCSRLPAT